MGVRVMIHDFKQREHPSGWGGALIQGLDICFRRGRWSLRKVRPISGRGGFVTEPTCAVSNLGSTEINFYLIFS